MDATAVTQRHGLGAPMGAWLAEAATLPPPHDGVPLPPRPRAEQALAPFALTATDTAELTGLWPDQDWPPEAWWLVERMYARIVADRQTLALGRGWRHWPSLSHVDDARVRCAPLFAFAAAVPLLRDLHRRHGVGEEVTAATLADVGRHVHQTRQMFGRVGLDTAAWIALHFRGGLYELGRLQFEPATLRPQGAVTWYDEEDAEHLAPALRHGRPVLRVHIPAGAPLAPDAVTASLGRARAFFRSRLGVDHPVATCSSWLLDPQLGEYLPESANIMAFQRRFTVLERDSPGDGDVFRFVFRIPEVRPERVRPRTRLERAVVDHVRSGRHWRVRTGWLWLPENQDGRGE